MGVPFAQIWWTDSSTGNSVEISDAIDWTAKRGISIKSNLVEIVLNNIAPDSQYSQYFDSDGKIKFTAGKQGITIEEADDIRLYVGTVPVSTADTTHLIMSCSITGVEQRLGEDEKSIKLNCADKTFQLLNYYTTGNFPVAGGSAPAYQLIQEAIKRSWQIRNSITDSIDITTYVGTAKSDLTPLMQTTYSAVYKPVYEVIDELSQIQYTGDTRPFIFWVDQNNALHWVYPAQSFNGTVNELTTDIYSMNIIKSERDEVNMIIYDCGKDKNGNNITWYKFNFTSDASKLKVVYMNWGAIVQEMKSPLSSYWDSHTNDEVRTQAKTIADAKCDAYFADKGMRWKGAMTLRGTKDYTAGDLIALTTTTFGFNNQKLRVMDVSHDIDQNGWTTTIDLEEDPLEVK
jgi:hypothetical protein